MNKQEIKNYLENVVKNQGSQSDAALIPLLRSIIEEVPTKVSELENDSEFVKSTSSARASAVGVAY